MRRRPCRLCRLRRRSGRRNRSCRSRPQAPPLATRLARALSVPHVPPSRSAAVAVDLSTGQTVFARHQALALVPASNQKLAVAFAALSLLGPAPSIRHAVFGEGELVGHDVEGRSRSQGLRRPDSDPRRPSHPRNPDPRVRHPARLGRIEADESYFDSRRTGPAWKSRYYLNESPALSALTVDRARFRGWLTGDPAIAAGTQFRLALR